MQIDWFTLIAQLVNFLILVFLLKYFLYDRIIEAMDTREEEIASRLKEAEEKRQEAEGEADSYRLKQNELEEKRAQILSKAQEEAEEKRRELFRRAKKEADEARSKWYRAIEQQQEAFLTELKRRAGESVHQIARRFLRELADTDLQSKMIETFMNRVREVETKKEPAVGKLAREQESLVVVSSFDIEPRLKQRLTHALGGEENRKKVRFRVSESLICGLELWVGEKKIAWSLDSSLDELKERVLGTLQKDASTMS